MVTIAGYLWLAPAIFSQVPVDVAGLVNQLGSRDYRVREKADAGLKAIGPRSLPQLQSALAANESPEVQRRLEALIEKFRAERLTSATRVTVNAKNEEVRDVLKGMCQQAGYVFTENVNSDLKVTLELKDVPFWVAVEKITAGTGIATGFLDDDRHTFTAYSGNQINPHVFCNGPFRFVASNINTSRNLQLANLPMRGQPQVRNNEYLNLNVQFYAEPKCPVVSVGTAVVTEASDDLGVSLVPQKVEAQSLPETRFYHGSMYKSLNQSFSVNLARGDRQATSIKELTGKVNLLLLSETRPELVIENVTVPGKKKAIGDTVEMEVLDLGEANGGYELNVIFRQVKPKPNEHGWWGNVYQRLELTDEKGAKFQASGVNEQKIGTGEVTIKLSYLPPEGKAMGKPRKLALMEWVTIEKSFEFTFKNIPLP